MSTLLGSLVPLLLGYVGDARLSPDGTRALFTETTVSGGLELFGAPADGSAEKFSLSGPMGTFNNVEQARFTPDGTRIVYFGDVVVDGDYELFSVSSAGGTPVRLNAPLGTSRDVKLFRNAPFVFTRSGDRVLFAADTARLNTDDLFVVPVDGSSAPVLLSNGTPFNRDVVEVLETPDQGHVVFLAGPPNGSVRELYVSPIDGSTPPVRLSAVGEVVSGFAVTDDSSWVVYRTPALRSVPIDGSAAPIPLGTGTTVSLVGVLPDGDVLYGSGSTLRRIPADGSGPDVVLATQVGTIPRLSPDRQWAIFSITQVGITWVYTVRTDGTASQNLVLFPPSDSLWGYEIGPDSQSIYYIKNNTLAVVPIDRSAEPTVVASHVTSFELVPGSTRMVLTERDAGTGANPRLSLFAPGSGQTPTFLGPGSVEDLAPDRGKRTIMAFPARQGSRAGTLLYLDGSALLAMPSDGSRAPVLLNP